MAISLYRRNVGGFDRWIRIVVGIGLVVLGLWTAANESAGHSGVLITVAGIAATVSGITGRCPMYVPFGISTLRRPS